jgi:hypothetical protein
MNKNQKKVIMAGLVVIVLMGLFPPWVHTVNVSTKLRTIKIERAGNYGLLFSPPTPADKETFVSGYWGVHLNVSRLLIQWILVMVVVCGLVVFLKEDNIKEA